MQHSGGGDQFWAGKYVYFSYSHTSSHKRGGIGAFPGTARREQHQVKDRFSVVQQSFCGSSINIQRRKPPSICFRHLGRWKPRKLRQPDFQARFASAVHPTFGAPRIGRLAQDVPTHLNFSRRTQATTTTSPETDNLELNICCARVSSCAVVCQVPVQRASCIFR